MFSPQKLLKGMKTQLFEFLTKWIKEVNSSFGNNEIGKEQIMDIQIIVINKKKTS